MAGKYSYEQTQENAKVKLREMLSRKSLAERWEPVQRELTWVNLGCPDQDQHQKILPEFCYNVLELYRRTLFRALSTPAETVSVSNKAGLAASKTYSEAKQHASVDWNKFGAEIGAGLRTIRFFKFEAEDKLKAEGLTDFSADESAELEKLLGGDWWQEKMKMIQAEQPEKPVEAIADEQFRQMEDFLKAAVPKWNEVAYQWSPEAIGQFNQGLAKGASEFLDAEGNMKGEGKLHLPDTYVMLLVAWPEIEEMINANPQKTRNDLWAWLQPFSYAGWIEIEDLEQLNRLCGTIKLKLKEPGAPRKV